MRRDARAMKRRYLKTSQEAASQTEAMAVTATNLSTKTGIILTKHYAPISTVSKCCLLF